MSLPKTLIIGQPFNNNSGGGITQANLFGNWDKDNIAVVSTVHMFNNLNTDICDTYYLLGNEEYKWKFPFNFLQRNVPSGVVKVKPGTGTQAQNISKKAQLRTKIINNYFYPFLEWIGLFHKISKITLSDKLRKWLDEYKPDVIYAQASSLETVQFCIIMQEYINKPMVYHVMDDWPSTISQKGPFKNFWHKKIDRALKVLLGKATVLLSISHDMAEEYKKRYGKDFITFHNPIDLNFWKSHQRATYTLAQTASILYAGRIGTGIQETLELLAKSIDNLNKELKTPVRFILQTKDIPAWVNNYSCVQHKPLVPYSELPKVFAEADFLYLPYDFSKESIKFIKYSMPTKAPEYMMSGTPVIILGPAETALVKDAQRGNWAKVITENSVDALAAAIKTLLEDENLRKKIAGNAVRIAEINYNAVKIRNEFENTISSIAS